MRDFDEYSTHERWAFVTNTTTFVDWVAKVRMPKTNLSILLNNSVCFVLIATISFSVRGWNALVGKKVSSQSKTIRLFDFRVYCFKTPEYVSLLSKRLRCCLSVLPGDMMGLVGSINSASRFWSSALMTSSGKKSSGKSTDSKSSSEETETSDPVLLTTLPFKEFILLPIIEFFLLNGDLVIFSFSS